MLIVQIKKLDGLILVLHMSGKMMGKHKFALFSIILWTLFGILLTPPGKTQTTNPTDGCVHSQSLC